MSPADLQAELERNRRLIQAESSVSVRPLIQKMVRDAMDQYADPDFRRKVVDLLLDTAGAKAKVLPDERDAMATINVTIVGGTMQAEVAAQPVVDVQAREIPGLTIEPEETESALPPLNVDDLPMSFADMMKGIEPLSEDADE